RMRPFPASNARITRQLDLISAQVAPGSPPLRDTQHIAEILLSRTDSAQCPRQPAMARPLLPVLSLWRAAAESCIARPACSCHGELLLSVVQPMDSPRLRSR
ncbi:MAG: hypothetical protein RBU37_24640, partial [Myxococcota bacterium]|nr:hypothetical protein [Myxococcota bacterium]